MPKLPQFEDEQPQLRVQGVRSKSAGYDAFGQFLGNLAESAVNQTLKLEEEQSNALAMQAQNDIATAQTKAKEEIIKNPNLSMQISKNYQDTINTITKNAYVNKQDRRQLEKLATTYNNNLDLTATESARRQMLLNTQTEVIKESSTAIMDIQRLYMSGDINGATDRQTTFSKTLDSALAIGAIKPSTYQKLQDANHAAINNAINAVRMMGHGDVRPKDYQKNNNTMLGEINNNKATIPSSSYTAYNQDHYNSETTYQKQASDITRLARITDGQAYLGLPAAKQQKLGYLWEGANDAYSSVVTNTDHLTLEKEFTDLKNKNQTGLSLQEEGKFKYLSNYFNRLENGEYLDVMRETSLGAKIEQEYINNNAAIMASSDTDEEKAKKIRDNNESKRMDYINLGFSMHMNPKYIKGVTKDEIAPYEMGFQAGQDPNLVISNLRQTDPLLRPYVADAMQKQHQAATLLVLGQAGENITQGYSRDMVMANQDGFDNRLIDVDKDSKTLSKIRGAIVSNSKINDALRYYSQLPLDQTKGQDLPDGLVDAFANTIILQAKRAGDYGVNQLDTYVNNAADQLAKATPIYTDVNMKINNATLKLADGDLKSLGNYITDQAYDKMRSQMGNDMAFYDLYDRKPYMVVNTPNNMLVLVNTVTGTIAMDKEGKPLFEQPYTDVLREAARHHQLKYDREGAEKTRKFKERHPFGFTYQ